MTIDFRPTTIRFVEQGIGWACADPGGGGGWGEGGGGMGSGPHRKITYEYMSRSRSKPPPAPDEISWFRAWGGGGGNLFHWNALEQIA